MAAPKGNKYSDGRDTLYKPEYDEQARKLCLLGLTDKELADFFGVCVATIANWKNKHSSFLDALKNGKSIADAELAQTLYDRAKGGKRIVKQRISEGVVVDVEEELPPDVTALIFWLKNRQPALWRDKPVEDKAEEDNTKRNYTVTLKVDDGSQAQ